MGSTRQLGGFLLLDVRVFYNGDGNMGVQQMTFPNLKGKIVGLDTETTGLKFALGSRVFGVSVAIDGFSGYWDVRIQPRVLEWLRDELPLASLVIGHNSKFDANMLRVEGINYLDTPWHCTMITDTLCYEHHREYNLDAVAYRRLGLGKRGDMVEEWRRMSGAKNKVEAMSTLHLAPESLVAPYAIRDAELLLPIYTSQMKDIDDQKLHRVYVLEMDLQPALADMEWGGVRTDVGAAEKSIPELTAVIDEEQSKLNAIAGFDVNVNSTPQIRKIFVPEKLNKYQYRLNDGTLCWATDAGNPSIDQHVLKEMTHPAAALIRRVRKVKKLRDTFVKGHILGNIDDRGYVHTTFNATRNDADAGTVTGRLSSTDPALQQINGRDKDTAKILRSMFLPDESHDWLGADFSSADFRIAAHYLNDPGLTLAYLENPNTDFHGFVAEMVGIPRSPRFAGDPNAKTLNLSMAFGAGGGKIAQSLGLPFDIEERNDKMFLVAGPEANQVINNYHKKFPAFRAFSKNAAQVAKERGYVMSLMGRKLRFVSNDSHKAAGYLFQSGCAECMKVALVRVWRMLRGTEYRLFLTVHDEVGISAPKDGGLLDNEIKRVYTDFNSPEAPFKLRIPMIADMKRGDNWYEGH